MQSIAEILERIGPEYAAKWCDVYGRIRAVVAENRDVGGQKQAATSKVAR